MKADCAISEFCDPAKNIKNRDGWAIGALRVGGLATRTVAGAGGGTVAQPDGFCMMYDNTCVVVSYT